VAQTNLIKLVADAPISPTLTLLLEQTPLCHPGAGVPPPEAQ
jgi:hypothetical protein